MHFRHKVMVPAVLALALMVAVLPVIAADDFRNGYQLGMEHGKKDSPMLNVLWGIVGGVIAFGIVAFTPPGDPGVLRMMELEDKSSDFKAGYIEGYSSGRQQMRYFYTGAGAALNVAVLLLGL
jgi:hypothetical protein